MKNQQQEQQTQTKPLPTSAVVLSTLQHSMPSRDSPGLTTHPQRCLDRGFLLCSSPFIHLGTREGMRTR